MMWFFIFNQAFAESAIVHARIHKTETTLSNSQNKLSKYHRVSWPFYSSYPFVYNNNPHWVELEIDISVYQKRRNDPHDSFATIIKTSQEDLLPLTKAFEDYFQNEGITSTAEQAGHVLGLIHGFSGGMLVLERTWWGRRRNLVTSH